MMNLKLLSSLALALPFAFLVGCSAETGEGADAPTALEAGADESPIDSDIIASVDVGYGTVTFHEFRHGDGSVAIAIGQSTDNTVGWTPLHDTMAAHTNLEVFLKLVPDQEPPQSYIDAHAGQAAELGRESSDVIEAHFDAEAPVEKTSAACKNWITPASQGCYSYTYRGIMELNNQTGQKSLTLSTTSATITAGVCNDGSYNVQGRLRWAHAGSDTFTNPGWTPNIPPGAGWVWFGFYVSGTCTPTPPNTICIPPNLSIRPRVEGRSTTSHANNTYDLRGAIIASSTYVCPPPR